MALAVLALLVSVPTLAAQGPTNRPDAAWRAGDTSAAVTGYLEQARAGTGGDTTWFNAGAVALAAGDSATARVALERAGRSVEPDVRFRALFDLGLLELRLAVSDSTSRAEHLAAAVRRYREALLLDPGHSGAKWNYELALRLLPPESSPPDRPAAGGAGGGGETEPPPQRGLTASEAEQILRSMAEAERETLRNQARRSRRAAETRGSREW
jgi:tetratricopeptide (TPR) repeat protein